MKLCIVGTGYVGLVTGTCFADVGNDVVCVDKNCSKIEMLRSGKSCIFEADLESMISRNIKDKKIHFTCDLQIGLSEAQVCFICVDTPQGCDGSADLSSVVSVAESIGQLMEKKLLVVMKSTVPVGSALKVKEIIVEQLTKRNKPVEWVSVASNPEFLKEGSAVLDFLEPDRVIVGTESLEDSNLLHELYMPFLMEKACFIPMDIASSELTKYASNSLLATKISFMNDLSRLAEKIGADIKKVRDGVGHDPRIGLDFLNAGLGYGGSCFPKDVAALIQMGKEYKSRLPIVEAVSNTNEIQKEWFWGKIEKWFDGNLKGKSMAIWGGAFKPNTDDIRCAPALFVIDKMLQNGVNVRLHDPVAMENIKGLYGDKINLINDPYDCLNTVDALVVVTEWSGFRSPDFDRMKTLMKSPTIFDGRNIYSEATLEEKGFQYFHIGHKQNKINVQRGNDE